MPRAASSYLAVTLLLLLAVTFPVAGQGDEVHQLRMRLAEARADLRAAVDVADELVPPDAFGSGGAAGGIAGTRRGTPSADVTAMAVQWKVRAADRRVRETEARLVQVLDAAAGGSVVSGLLEQVRSLVPPQRDDETAGRLVAPVQGVVTSGFGPRRLPSWGEDHMHEGIDIFAPSGTEVVAAAAGEVVFTGQLPESGISVIVDHGLDEQGRAMHTVYSHLSTILVLEGQDVEAGEALGAVGSTGTHSTGPHLHFEVRVEGEAVDPRAWL